MGKVIEHKPGQFINFQWMSNFNQSRLAKFLPMWFQPSDKKSYYKAKPTSPAHPPYTGKDLGVFIKADDLILVSGLTTFLEEDILKPWALSFILRDELVQQAVKDFDSRRKTPNL
jgi:hypothetical protein